MPFPLVWRGLFRALDPSSPYQSRLAQGLAEDAAVAQR